MNIKNAKILSQKEFQNILPNSWNENFTTILSIIKHSEFCSFKHLETFIVNALSYILDKETNPIKHIKVNCIDKGEHNGKIYITIEMYFYMKDKHLWKLSKSVHVLKREKINIKD